ncbi:hypothetical protein NDU88_005351 [Pleurodeles waltl]|uniref:Peptidase S1 domain-containing protein n=1 Tax=Pleurodeles waltl TaxID=8319 RepID=A0AAV7WB71_PLEWA|nr:hypothetical protein NDU88_005351 [Pleurodeles waltl]
MRLSFTIAASAALLFLILPGDSCMEIIGGTEVAAHSRPYMALIRDNGFLRCGGTLIKDDWVLTAAHCNITKKTSSVILGVHQQLANETEQQTFIIKKTIPHPCFNRRTHDNDIMLLQLNKKAKRSKAVSPYPPPSKGGDVKEGTVCEAAGWGQKNKNRIPAKALMAVNLTVISRSTCNNHSSYKPNVVITMNMLCAGEKNGGKDTCNGDSGGPLICNRELRGITSFGPTQCGTAGKPSVYTLLTDDYLNWIRKMTGGDL